MRYLFIGLLAFVSWHCRSERKEQSPPQTGSAEDASATTDRTWVHFRSVAWSCVQVERSQLAQASYTIQDYEVSSGPCPETLPVLSTISRPLLTCDIVIGPPRVPARYILFDKRTLDGETIRDLRAEGFSKDNFCPMLASKVFE